MTNQQALARIQFAIQYYELIKCPGMVQTLRSLAEAYK